jgi:peptide/nickel transport system permease protein
VTAVAALILRRLAGAGARILLVATAAFLLVRALPGGPGTIPEDPRVPPAHAERLREQWGLERPLAEQYARFLAAAAAGDWGPSLAQNRPAVDVVLDALPWTLGLALVALALELAGGLAIGAAAARHPGGRLDHLLRVTTLAIHAIPGFWLALLLLAAFAVRLPLLPAGGTPALDAGLPWPARLFELGRYVALPALAIGLPAAAGAARFVRAALIEVAGEPFVLAARARGLARRIVFFRHALAAAAGPLLQNLGFSIGALLSGSLAVEIVFSWPGLGRAAYDALLARDYTVLVACATLSASAVVAGSTLAELAHAAADPRTRDA